MKKVLSLVLITFLCLSLTYCTSEEPHKNRANFQIIWKKVEKFKNEQKYNRALQEVLKIYKLAKEVENQEEWCKSLIEIALLQRGLHTYEKCVNTLMNEKWPTKPRYRAFLHLFYGYLLWNYYNIYSWEIDNRKEIKSKKRLDIKKWTAYQIFKEIDKQFEKAFQFKDILYKLKVKDYSRYIKRNYPDEILNTLLDFLIIQWTDFLSNTRTWKPIELKEKYRLNIEKLAQFPKYLLLDTSFLKKQLHPLKKCVKILNYMYNFHLKKKEYNSALELQLEKIRKISYIFDRKRAKEILIKILKENLPKFREYKWWSMGRYELACLIKEIGDLVQAHKIAKKTFEIYPNALGGKKCLNLYKTIEAPDFYIKTMKIDKPNTNSIQITYKNIDHLYFRIYKLDYFETLKNRKKWGKSYYKEIVKKEPLKEWKVELENLKDYKYHKAYTIPKVKDIGFYLIISSYKKDFSFYENKILYSPMFISNISIITSQKQNILEVYVLNGNTGKPIPSATVTLYYSSYYGQLKKIRSLTTNQQGKVIYKRKNTSINLIHVEKGKDYIVESRYFYMRKYSVNTYRQSILIYTDRAIYRPGQKIYFKLITYAGDYNKGKFNVLPNINIKVTLKDPNYQTIQTLNLKTNKFGTANGEFLIPKGRLLGEYRIICSSRNPKNNYRYFSNSAYIRVEEYKRPKFEVKLYEFKKQPKLNKLVKIEGEAIYYFGLPLTNAKIFYRITRTPIFPWWYWWFYPRRDDDRYAYEVASGITKLQNNGKFIINFIPKADPTLKNKNIFYNFKVQIEVTDEGGETIKAEKNYLIGFQSITGDIILNKKYYTYGENIKLTIKRTNLNGFPQPGTGEYKLVKLQQPKEVITPDKFPIYFNDKEKHTNGDKIRPRWEPDKTLEQYLFCFKDGKTIKTQKINHDKNGETQINLGKLEPGVYRVYYTTKDIYGEKYETHREFIIFSPDNPQIKVPLILLAQKTHVKVGENALILVGSGIKKQSYWVEIYKNGKILKRDYYQGKIRFIEIPIDEKYRGGFTIRAFMVHDYKFYFKIINIYVPWDNKKLTITFKTFRDKLQPGKKETWIINIKGPNKEKVVAEILSYMYDRSLDYFVKYHYPNIENIYPLGYGCPDLYFSIDTEYFRNLTYGMWYYIPSAPDYSKDRLVILDNYPIGGLGRRRYRVLYKGKTFAEEESEKCCDEEEGFVKKVEKRTLAAPKVAKNKLNQAKPKKQPKKQIKQIKIRKNFQETAFFKPSLVTDKNGDVKIIFTVPDTLTSWNFYIHAITKDLKFLSLKKEVVTQKDLMVKTYLPRFFREEDEAVLKVAINNNTNKTLIGDAYITIKNIQQNKEYTHMFGIREKSKLWKVKPKSTLILNWKLSVPPVVGDYLFKVIANTQNFSDGEQIAIPVLPSRVHLIQSKFIVLKDKQTKEVEIKDLKESYKDPTLIHESLIIDVDAQLMYTVLKALPYLINYPYECIEQTLNRFISTSIVYSILEKYPNIKKMAKEFSKRKTQLEPWNTRKRKLRLEETPWLNLAQGGRKENLINVLNPEIVKAQKLDSLKKIQKAQLPNGAFPWWAGGPPSPYITLYILYGFAKALEFNVKLPPYTKPMIKKAWKYVGNYIKKDILRGKSIKQNEELYCYLTYLNYILSCYKDSSYYSHVFTQKDREDMAEISYKNWKKLSPYLKAYLSLTLMRMDKPKKAKLVFESIMDSAITTEDQGTFWQPEDRAWLWYNDTTETQAFMLRALQEIDPTDKKHIDGLVLWLLLHKKLNQWKSTRTTAEVIYSLAYTLKKQKKLGIKEIIKIKVGNQKYNFQFNPNKYIGTKQIYYKSWEIRPERMYKIIFNKITPGYMFASVNWCYSTQKMPKQGRGDFLKIKRKYYVRRHVLDHYILEPVDEGAPIHLGDQIEVHISIKSKFPMEYIHLRDPRPAGFEPETNISKYYWDLGIYWYQETRDTSTNFFFERLPQGEYNFIYRIRASMIGEFKVGPATIESMYSPDFHAFSSGATLKIEK